MAEKELSQKEMKEIKGGMKINESAVRLKEAETLQDSSLAQKTAIAPPLSPTK